MLSLPSHVDHCNHSKLHMRLIARIMLVEPLSRSIPRSKNCLWSHCSHVALRRIYFSPRLPFPHSYAFKSRILPSHLARFICTNLDPYTCLICPSFSGLDLYVYAPNLVLPHPLLLALHRHHAAHLLLSSPAVCRATPGNLCPELHRREPRQLPSRKGSIRHGDIRHRLLLLERTEENTSVLGRPVAYREYLNFTLGPISGVPILIATSSPLDDLRHYHNEMVKGQKPQERLRLQQPLLPAS